MKHYCNKNIKNKTTFQECVTLAPGIDFCNFPIKSYRRSPTNHPPGALKNTAGECKLGRVYDAQRNENSTHKDKGQYEVEERKTF